MYLLASESPLCQFCPTACECPRFLEHRQTPQFDYSFLVIYILNQCFSPQNIVSAYKMKEPMIPTRKTAYVMENAETTQEQSMEED